MSAKESPLALRAMILVVALTQSFLAFSRVTIINHRRWPRLPSRKLFTFSPGVGAEQVCLMTAPDGLIIVGAMYECRWRHAAMHRFSDGCR